MSDDIDNVTEIKPGQTKASAASIAKQIEAEFNKGEAEGFKKELKELLAKERELQKALKINKRAQEDLKQRFEQGLV
jgi:hypothetical protein